MAMSKLLTLSGLVASVMLGGCAVNNPQVWEAPKLMKPSTVQNRLLALPPPSQKVAVAVYGFTDQTGQFKPSDTIQTLSRAVTQGATSILVKALQDAGQRQWFTVIEREKLDNVLRERAVIREMRANYLGEKGINPQALPPLLFAGILLEGGIIGFDSNVKTGGSGARFLGIGGKTEYREDTVTVYLRAVSTKTGEVLSSVSVRKGIQSVAIGGNAFRFVSFKDLLEIDTGITYNEPDQIALTQAIEKAVYALIAEGALQDLWCFSGDRQQAAGLLAEYLAERDSVDRADVRVPARADGSPIGWCRAPVQASDARGAPGASAPAAIAQAAALSAQPRLEVELNALRPVRSGAGGAIVSTAEGDAMN
jgi:curli production assembly/transport component CsgG